MPHLLNEIHVVTVGIITIRLMTRSDCDAGDESMLLFWADFYVSNLKNFHSVDVIIKGHTQLIFLARPSSIQRLIFITMACTRVEKNNSLE